VRFWLALCATTAWAQTAIPLEQLDLAKATSFASPMGYPANASRSVAGQPLTMKGKVYEHGVGLHSGSRVRGLA
jgi:hypothetical protein